MVNIDLYFAQKSAGTLNVKVHFAINGSETKNVKLHLTINDHFIQNVILHLAHITLWILLIFARLAPHYPPMPIAIQTCCQ